MIHLCGPRLLVIRMHGWNGFVTIKTCNCCPVHLAMVVNVRKHVVVNPFGKWGCLASSSSLSQGCFYQRYRRRVMISSMFTNVFVIVHGCSLPKTFFIWSLLGPVPMGLNGFAANGAYDLPVIANFGHQVLLTALPKSHTKP